MLDRPDTSSDNRSEAASAAAVESRLSFSGSLRSSATSIEDVMSGDLDGRASVRLARHVTQPAPDSDQQLSPPGLLPSNDGVQGEQPCL